MTLVKICGVSEVTHARTAAALGADFVGVVFAPSRRQVTLGQAKRIASGLRKDGEPAPDGTDAGVLTAPRRCVRGPRRGHDQRDLR